MYNKTSFSYVDMASNQNGDRGRTNHSLSPPAHAHSTLAARRLSSLTALSIITLLDRKGGQGAS